MISPLLLSSAFAGTPDATVAPLDEAAPAEEAPVVEAGFPKEGVVYAGQVDIGTLTEMSVVGDIHVVVRSATHVTFEKEGDQWFQVQKVCDVKNFDDTRMSTTIIPKAFIAAIPVTRFPVDLTDTTDGGVRYKADPGVEWVGLDPLPDGEELPHKPDDPRVLDFDGDGKPGATVVLEVPVFKRVELYVVQAAQSIYEGVVKGEAVAGDTIMTRLDQRTLKATAPFFKAQPPVKPVADLSSFRIWPLGPGADCAAVIAAVSKVSPFDGGNN